MARVTNLENGRSIILKISDRGPFKYDRVLDVSAAAARALGFYQQGTARVHVKTLVAESASLPENQSPSRRGNQTLKKGLKNGIQQRGTSVKRPPLLPLSVTLDALCETPDASPSPSLDALLAG
jgi:rare lipoprotein A